jgi:uncharacterized protein
VKKDKALDARPWWSYGHVWLVISGPVSVVIACIVTFYFIINSPNEVLSRQDVEITHDKSVKLMAGSDAPAMMAMNHAATGLVPVPKSTLATPKK